LLYSQQARHECFRSGRVVQRTLPCLFRDFRCNRALQHVLLRSFCKFQGSRAVQHTLPHLFRIFGVVGLFNTPYRIYFTISNPEGLFNTPYCVDFRVGVLAHPPRQFRDFDAFRCANTSYHINFRVFKFSMCLGGLAHPTTLILGFSTWWVVQPMLSSRFLTCSGVPIHPTVPTTSIFGFLGFLEYI